MKIINNFTLICTLFIIQFLNSQRTSKSLRSAKVLAVSLYLLSRLTRSAVAILWDNIGEALNLSQEVVHGSQSQGSDLEELWYLCLDPTAPTAPARQVRKEEEEGVKEEEEEEEDLDNAEEGTRRNPAS